LCYELEVQRLENALLLQGRLHLTLQCHCVRCRKAKKMQPSSTTAWT
jgi:hypothetical protein